jgi:shikimate dehydrogenase
MHNAAFEASGSDYVYVAMDVRPEYLFAAIDGLRALGFRGFNVTMPHKEAILPLLDELYDAARISGSVNTVVVEEGRLHGTNTDDGGFVEACEESGVGFAGARVLLVEDGGAAAAAIGASVLDEGVAEVRVLNRSRGAPSSCGTGCTEPTPTPISRCMLSGNPWGLPWGWM